MHPGMSAASASTIELTRLAVTILLSCLLAAWVWATWRLGRAGGTGRREKGDLS